VQEPEGAQFESVTFEEPGSTNEEAALWRLTFRVF
jgi:hypothetical protein